MWLGARVNDVLVEVRSSLVRAGLDMVHRPSCNLQPPDPISFLLTFFTFTTLEGILSRTKLRQTRSNGLYADGAMGSAQRSGLHPFHAFVV